MTPAEVEVYAIQAACDEIRDAFDLCFVTDPATMRGAASRTVAIMLPAGGTAEDLHARCVGTTWDIRCESGCSTGFDPIETLRKMAQALATR